MSKWKKDQIRAVWRRAYPAERGDPAKLRRDVTGHLIRFKEYDQRSLLGWQITYILPPAAGGTDDLLNLRPLHWSAATIDEG